MQSDADQPQGPQAAVFHLPLLSVYRIRTGTMSQHHQLSLQGKCAGIIISLLTSAFLHVLQHLHGEPLGREQSASRMVSTPGMVVCELFRGSG